MIEENKTIDVYDEDESNRKFSETNNKRFYNIFDQKIINLPFQPKLLKIKSNMAVTNSNSIDNAYYEQRKNLNKKLQEIEKMKNLEKEEKVTEYRSGKMK